MIPVRPFFALSLATLAGAQIRFEQTEVSHTAGPTETVFEAVYAFVNEGEETVEITELHSSCGCTVPALEKRRYAPGEGGEVKAVFNYGSRLGEQHKRITVETSAGSHALLLHVTIPEKWRLQNRFVIWKHDQLAEVRTIQVEFLLGLPVELLAVDLGGEDLEAEPVWSPDGRSCELRLRIKAEGAGGLRRCQAHFRNAFGEEVEIPFYLRIDR